MVSNFFDKKTSGSCIKNENMSDEKLADELRKSVIRKFNRRKVNYANQLSDIFNRQKVHSPFIDNICAADLGNMQLIKKLYKGIRFYYVLLTFIANMHELFH